MLLPAHQSSTMALSTSGFLAIFTPLVRLLRIHFVPVLIPLQLGISLMFTSAYSWWNISHLHLPLSKLVAFLGTLIPILSLGSIQYLRTAHRQSTKSRRRKGNQLLSQLTDKMFLVRHLPPSCIFYPPHH